MHGIGQPDFRDADNSAATNVAEAAKEAGVGRIVYLGGFVPEEGDLSEHLTSRAEVAAALSIEGGPEVVWLGAAMIIGAGSTSFEMLRYVGDRFVRDSARPEWMNNPMDPISISDVLYYLAIAADADRVPAGAYDISGPETTTYRDLLAAYGRATGKWRVSVPIRGVDTGVASMLTAAVLPVPGGLAADLVESLDHPMRASDGLRELVSDPPGGLLGIDDAITRSLPNGQPRPVNELTDPHHLADTDPAWAGGDTLRIRRLARSVTPPIVRPVLGLINAVPGPVAAALRTGLDTLINLTPKAHLA